MPTDNIPPILIAQMFNYVMFGIAGILGGLVLARWWKKKILESKVQKDIQKDKKDEPPKTEDLK